MTDWLARERLLVKDEGIEKLQSAHVLVVGLGGVGAVAAEFLVRAGIETLTIVDGDTVDFTNINRQLPALRSTVGKSKVQVVGERLLDINPELELYSLQEFITPERATELMGGAFDYVADCIDSISPKLYIISAALERKIPLVSSMGAGGKLHAGAVRVADISKTNTCVMARNIRKRLRKMGIKKGFQAVFSEEIPDESSMELTDGTNFKKSYYGTISYIPAVFGIHMAETIICDILKKHVV